MLGFYIRKATHADITAVNAIARQYPNELGYVRNVSLARAIDKGELNVACNAHDEPIGFVNYHRLIREPRSTIYEIAVRKNYEGMGIGRNLFFSVPAPIRLKVTMDNVGANAFYKSLNMRLIGTEAGRKRPLNVYELKTLFIFCQGGNKEFPIVARRCGVAYGTRADDTAQDYPFMIDIKWDSYNWDNYLATVGRLHPVMATAPDYTDKSQYEALMGQIADLRALGVMRIVCVPKFKGAVKDIPNDCIIGVSIPSSYAGYPLDDEDVSTIGGRYVHLLGGTPKAQRAFYNDYTARGVHVISMDGNGFQKGAQFGAYFEGGKWKRPANRRFVHGDMHETMCYSLSQIVAFMNADKSRQMSLF